MKIYRIILSISPWLEVMIKSFYWKSSFIYRLLSPKTRSRNHRLQKRALNNLEFSRVTDALNKINAGHKGIIIVHSSMIALANTGLTPKEICCQLLNYIGPDGTLAMPAMPLYPEEPVGPARMGNVICKQRLVYDVRRTRIWTGAVPAALMNMPGAVRSRHPINTMVAVGIHAAKMMEHNIEGPLPMPCGPKSSWKYCADRDATIVCLGVDSSHSLTMIHVAEDSWSKDWPISNWYRKRMFHVKDGDFETDLNVMERHPQWSMYYAERTLQKDLLNLGIIQVKEVGGIRIETCSSTRLIDYLISRRASAYPYWIPFWNKIK